MIKQFIYLFIFLSANKLKAQNVFTGRVFNEKNISIVNASIKLKDSTKGVIKYFALTDTKGYFSIKLPSISKSLLAECSFIGYKTNSFVLEIAPSGENKIISRDILLIPDTTTLQEINVRAIPPIKISGDTTTFRADAFKQGNETSVGDLLNNIPGFSVEEGKIKYNGKTVSRVLIEDDDLFGQDYNTVTQNLSPRGIEKIELIKNYNDKTYLSNRMQQGKELVINLKFQNKYLYKVIASNEGGVDPAFSFYKIRQNIVSLIPKIKFVTTTNFNNIGVLGSELLGVQPIIQELAAYKRDGINFDLQPRFTTSFLSQIPDITSGIVPKNKLVFNHSTIVTNNLLYKISPKLLIKNIVQFYRDVYHQQQNKAEDYTFSGINLLVTDQQYVQKKTPSWNISSEFIYTITPATQLIYKINYNTNNERDSSVDIRQQITSINNTLNLTARNLQQQLGLSIKVDSNKILDIRAEQSNSNYQQMPSIYPAYLYRSLTKDSLFPNIKSFISDEHDEYNLQAKLSSKLKRGYYSLEALYTKTDSKLNSNAVLFNDTSSQIVTNTSLINNSYLKNSIVSIGLDLTKPLISKVIFRVLQKIEAGNITFNNSGNNIFHNQYFNYLPTAGLKINLGNRRNFDIQWSIKNKLPQIYDFFSSSIITSSTDVTKGAGTINFGLSNSISFAYSFADPIKSKLIGLVILSHSRESILYLTNRNPTIFYNVNNKIAFPNDGVTWSGFSNISKYVSIIKSQLSLEMSAFKHETYYSLNSHVGSFSLSAMNPNFKCKTLLTNKLTTSIGVKASFIVQDFDKGQSNSSRTFGNTYTYTGELTYRFSQSLVFNTRYQHISQSQSNVTHNSNFLDASLKYILKKDKLNFTVSGNNIFNSKQFTTTTFTQISTVMQSINVLPSYILLQATIEF